MTRVFFFKAHVPGPVKRIRFAGLPVAVENPKGSVRSGTDRGGRTWRTKMVADYGEVPGTLGADGDPYDVFCGPDEAASTVYVMETMAPPDFAKRDEEKAMVGFPSEAAAREAFLASYDNPRFLGRVVAMPLAAFKRRLAAAASTGGRVIPGTA